MHLISEKTWIKYTLSKRRIVKIITDASNERCAFETSSDTCQSTRRNTQEDLNFYHQLCNNPRSHTNRGVYIFSLFLSIKAQLPLIYTCCHSYLLWFHTCVYLSLLSS